MTKWARSDADGNKEITGYLLINFDWQSNHKLSPSSEVELTAIAPPYFSTTI
ncbi:hypothetical protein [Nostoc sp.]|uniref:hypothetical protein n=1 Tax=Nostoc sp. TaxID=1180 RepID=UPI002FFCE55B